ncbi:type 2 isopentenyl-diphosphate Delta-isomerase [Marinilabiliaceae bacterium JC017]|nr:type 2 isopentenyl-diphosphate Delta-isomerase [Marinilabiliaceae bacterium JC017]
MEDRKKDHIEMAFNARAKATESDRRFFYEPLFGTHTTSQKQYTFAEKVMKLPLWISSMTGGTQKAGLINRNLARACNEFGMGMGLGSCRILLDSPKHLPDFDVRHIIGQELPLFANLGICQLEQMLEEKSTDKIEELVTKLQADGLIIHINPLQEAFQPEGDRLKRPPIELLEAFLENTNLKIIVKEVGQGMGPKSLKALMQLPLEAIEFSALGGTNFTMVELNRSNAVAAEVYNQYGQVGHTAEEMVHTINEIKTNCLTMRIKCRQIIISGGITSVLDGYHLTNISKIPAIFGMGSAFLRHAMGDYDQLKEFVQHLAHGLDLAENFLSIR